jgi:hypothetical protein
MGKKNFRFDILLMLRKLKNKFFIFIDFLGLENKL